MKNYPGTKAIQEIKAAGNADRFTNLKAAVKDVVLFIKRMIVITLGLSVLLCGAVTAFHIDTVILDQARTVAGTFAAVDGVALLFWACVRVK